MVIKATFSLMFVLDYSLFFNGGLYEGNNGFYRLRRCGSWRMFALSGASLAKSKPECRCAALQLVN